MNLTDFKLVMLLTTAHMRHRPARMLLTVLSTIAAACIVVWVVSGYDSLLVKFDEFADNYLGRYEFVALPVSDSGEARGPFGAPTARLSPQLIAELQHDPAVTVIDPILQTRARISKVGATPEELERARGPRPGGGPGAGGGRRGRTAEVPATEAAAAASTEQGGARGKAATPNPDDSDVPVVPRGPGGFGANRNPSLVGTNATEAPYNLLEGEWIDPKQPDAHQAVVSSGVAEQLSLKLGDEVQVAVGFGGSSVSFKVVGIVEQRKPLPTTPPIIGLPAMKGPPLTGGPASAAVYIPLATAEQIAGVSQKYDFAGIILKRGYKVEEFKRNWSERLLQASPPAVLQSMQEIDSELNDSTTSDTIRSQAFAATGISLLAALFIIFSTLSMGVDERIRQLAMLRAVTLTRAQVAAMITLESLFLGLIGWGGGLLAGWGLLTVMTRMRPDLFPVGSRLGIWCIALSGVCAVGGALAASIMPAWKATRVKPLEAMAPQPILPVSRISIITTILGLILISLNPLLVFWVPMPDTSRYLISAAVGCTAMGIGFILLAPATILLTDRLLAPIVARLFWVSPQLLATQLTTNLWRTLGTTIALTLGLGLFVAMQTWGYSMLGPFTPGNWVPDLIANMSPTGIPDSEVEAVRQIKGVVGDRSLPCISEQVKFAADVTGAHERATSSRQDNCVLVGVDPELSLGGTKPVFDFQFAEGTRADALAKLKQGRFCLVPDHFARESGLAVGDKFGVVPPNDSKQVVEYEIAGVVSMTGWHWMSKVGLRNRGGTRSAGLMFAAFDQVRKDFGVQRINAFWLNLDGTATEEEVKASLETIVERNFDPSLVRGRGGRGNFGMGMNPAGGGPGGGGRRQGYSTTVNIRSREGVRAAIRERAAGIIWLLSRLPLVTLLVTALGVINTIISSIRARRWDLGVMRSLGVTRFTLFRMILCEAVLVGVAACILSFGFGTMAGYCGTGVTRYVTVRGGQITPLIIPWLQVGYGFAMTLGLCLIAALWPAIRTGRAEPLKLLQAGRSAI
jgi:putative ABC transport system permease protein